MSSTWLDELKNQAPGLQVRENVPMKNYTTFRIGGPAEYMIEPSSEEELLLVRQTARKYGIPFFLMGHGSNLLVLDGGIPGITVRLGSAFSRVEFTGDTEWSVQAGAMLGDLAKKAQVQGLSGLEFASGIPGTVGGGLYMNAGAYGGEMVQVVTGADLFDGSKVIHLDKENLTLSYRHSLCMDRPELIILRVYLKLTPGDPETIRAVMDDLSQRRRDKQPLSLPSAGSFFKRPQGDYAARLIEVAGLKGFRVGGAAVSDKHAGFVVNLGDATVKDVFALMEEVQKRVEAMSGIRLSPEVRFVGVEG